MKGDDMPDTDDISRSPGEWIRTFACRLAIRHPELSPPEVLQLAISEFETSHDLPPERAAVCCQIAVQRARARREALR
jgi:hypothetical protein